MGRLSGLHESFSNLSRVEKLQLVRDLLDHQSETIVEDLTAVLELEKDVAVRRMAIIALGRQGGNVALDPLVAALGDANEIIRAQAVRALAKFKGQEARSALFDALKDQSPAVRVQSIRALTRVGGKEFGSYLRDVLFSDPAPEVRKQVVIGLQRYRGEESRAKLLRAATDEDAGVRKAAKAALKR